MTRFPNTMKYLATIAIMGCTTAGALAQSTSKAPSTSKQPQIEVGRVTWSTDWAGSSSDSRKDGKPLFVQFQEIPGCETCQNYGRSVLSHPLMVEAIEDNFHPLLVYNNRDGEDATILKKFGEPSWNNPVVRLLDSDQKDLIPRKDRVWKRDGVAGLMIQALTAAKQPVPKYLQLIASESSPPQNATFAMHCFWEGEAQLGRLPGVHSTSAGWIGDKEVVKLKFDPKVISYERLVKEAQSMKCASTVFSHDKKQHATAKTLVGDKVATWSPDNSRLAKESDRKYYLKNSPLRYLPLTTLQSTKINAALGSQADWKEWLSPRQMRLAMMVRRFLAEQPKGLGDFTPPEDVENQAEYQARLKRFLDDKLAMTNQ